MHGLCRCLTSTVFDGVAICRGTSLPFIKDPPEVNNHATTFKEILPRFLTRWTCEARAEWSVFLYTTSVKLTRACSSVASA